MHSSSKPALVDRLSRYGRLVEVGVGRRPAVAAALAARGRRVTATDVHDRDVPDGVRFVRDDVTAPDPGVYRGADAVYALNCPPELQRPLATVAARAGADCLFTTLGCDPAVVDATPETLPGAGASNPEGSRNPEGPPNPSGASNRKGASNRGGTPNRSGTPPGETLFRVEP